MKGDYIPKSLFSPILLCLLNEPLPEQGLGHSFQGGILPLQQIYFVVQTAEDVRNGFLFGKGRKNNWKIA